MKQKSYSFYNESRRTVFPVESTNNMRIKGTYLRVWEINALGKGYHL